MSKRSLFRRRKVFTPNLSIGQEEKPIDKWYWRFVLTNEDQSCLILFFTAYTFQVELSYKKKGEKKTVESCKAACMIQGCMNQGSVLIQSLFVV